MKESIMKMVNKEFAESSPIKHEKMQYYVITMDPVLWSQTPLSSDCRWEKISEGRVVIRTTYNIKEIIHHIKSFKHVTVPVRVLDPSEYKRNTEIRKAIKTMWFR